jgi:hypothetical protein
MRLFQPFFLLLAFTGSLSLPLNAEDSRVSYSQEELTVLPINDILNIWKKHTSSQGAFIERSAGSFARFCSSLGMTLRPVTRYGIECYDIYYGKQWYFVDPMTLNLFLDLNNETYVSSEQIMDDPFIFLRNHFSDLENGYNQLARFDIIHPAQGEEIPPNPERMVPDPIITPQELSDSDLRASFDPQSRIFHLQESQQNSETKKIGWQIASDSEFSHIQIERQQPATSTVELSPLLETFLNADQPYFFRYREHKNSSWSRWSESISFTIDKPKAIECIDFENLGNHTYQISWRAEKLPDIEYLVFGSNELDFIPSIYLEENTSNLVAVTSSPEIIVDGSLAYYRVIAKKEGRLSTPSPIIHVYDHALEQQRTVLQVIDGNGIDFIVNRVEIPGYSAVEKSSSFKIHPFVSQEVWDAVKPYFLPVNHPIKSKLDRMFSEKRVTMTPDTFRKAGFKRYHPGTVSHIMASNHPKLEGYYIKAFSDLEPTTHDWQKLVHRIIGANSINAYITSHNYKKEFDVPKKWIYPLPADPSPPKFPKYHRKNFILVAQDMRILGHDANNAKYKKEMTRPLLDTFFCILRDEGLNDSVYSFNVPFCRNGKLAFIDTERHHYTGVIHYEKLLRYFSLEMQAYWKILIKNNGPEGNRPQENNG